MFDKIFHMLRFNVIPAILHPLMKNQVYTVRYGLAKGLRKKGGLGFVPQATTIEENFLMNLDLCDQVVYDVGAAYGVFTLFFARSVGKNGKVIAFEPNPKLSKQVSENVRLNHFENVEVCQIALGKERKRETLAFTSRILGIGSLEVHEKHRILSLKNAESVSVQVDTIDNLVGTGKLPKPDFVKIDVQGVELDVLLGMKQIIQECKPKIFVEIHSIPYIDWKTDNTAETLKFLQTEGYSTYHIESERFFNPSDSQKIEEDEHLFCI